MIFNEVEAEIQISRYSNEKYLDLLLNFNEKEVDEKDIGLKKFNWNDISYNGCYNQSKQRPSYLW